MSLSIDQAFIKQFESDVHVAFQRMGSKLQGTLRVKPNVQGSQTRFQKVGKGTAVQKSRHGQVPVMNLDHTNVEVAQSSAGALGRKVDELICTALDGTSNVQAESGSARLTQAKINAVFAGMGENDVPDDGDRYFIVSPDQWIDLLAISAFTNADFIGPDELPYKGGMVAKRWLGFLWMTFSGLPLASGKRQAFAYHRAGAGVAIAADVRTEINYIPERVSNLITAYMSMGVVLIDDTAVYEIQSAE